MYTKHTPWTVELVDIDTESPMVSDVFFFFAAKTLYRIFYAVMICRKHMYVFFHVRFFDYFVYTIRLRFQYKISYRKSYLKEVKIDRVLSNS